MMHQEKGNKTTGMVTGNADKAQVLIVHETKANHMYFRFKGFPIGRKMNVIISNQAELGEIFNVTIGIALEDASKIKAGFFQNSLSPN